MTKETTAFRLHDTYITIFVDWNRTCYVDQYPNSKIFFGSIVISSAGHADPGAVPSLTTTHVRWSANLGVQAAA